MKTVFFLIKRQVLGQEVHLGSVRDFAKSLWVLKDSASPSSALLVSSYTLTAACSDPELASALQKADIVIPKGATLLKGIRILYGVRAEQITVWKLLETLCREQEMTSCAYHGDVNFRKELQARFPQLTLREPGEDRNDLTLLCLSPAERGHYLSEQNLKGCVLSLGDGYFRPPFLQRCQESVSFRLRVLGQKLFS